MSASDHLIVGSAVHVYPVDDLVEHELVGDNCICGPQPVVVKCDDGSIEWVIAHHSLDGRELSE